MTRAPYSYRDDPAIADFADDKAVFVFDGHCVLCSQWAQIMLRHDTDRKFRLLTAQSPLGRALFEHYGLMSETGDYSTNLLIQNGKARLKSDGTLSLMSQLGFPLSLMGIFKIVPPPLRDWAYNIIARNRIKWFGRRELCYVPRPEDKDRFL